MPIKRRIHDALHRVGLDVVPYSGAYFASKRRVELMHRHAVDLVVDVGANRGQFATEIRRDGWTGPILSLEPLPEAFRLLSAASSRDRSWVAVNAAAGASAATLTMNVAGNSWSSSLLPMTEAHLDAAPDSRYTDTVEVEVRTVDDVVEASVAARRPYLKADTQGYELEVLSGAARTLAAAPLVELELSLVELYAGQPLIREIVQRMLDEGFAPVGAAESFVRDGAILQVDAIFLRVV